MAEPTLKDQLKRVRNLKKDAASERIVKLSVFRNLKDVESKIIHRIRHHEKEIVS